MPRSTSPPASSSQNIQCRRTRSTVAHIIRSARDPGWLAAGNAVSLLSVTQNPRQGPAAFLAGLILPHQKVTDGRMGKFWLVSSLFATRPEPLVGAHLYHRPMPGSTTAAGAWFTLRRRTTIYPPEPAGRPGICAVCRGPARPGYARCYQCGQHDLLGPGLLADAVVPISYAVKGTAFAVSLWRYKSWRSPDPAARTALLTLLLTFLHDHGRCVWRHAGMP